MTMTEKLKIIKQALKETLIERRPVWQLWKHFKYRYAWGMRPLLKHSDYFPLDVDVELCGGCNFRCQMCQQATGWAGPEMLKKFMSWETLKKVVEECKSLGVYSMKVNWRGEPTLDPDASNKIKYIKQMGIHEVQMNTNGSRLTPALCDSLIDSGLDRIIFSCDGLSKETYNSIRKGGDFNRFVENVKLFRQRRHAKDVTRKWYEPKGVPKIRINTAVMNENKHEIPLFREFFKDIADEFLFNTVYQPQAANVNSGQHRIEKRKGCPQIWQRLVIDVDGDVVSCCVNFRKIQSIGNINGKTIEEMWNDRAGLGIRRMHISHRAREMEMCRSCDNFALSEISLTNEVIWR